jgi:hypothetical protein
VSQVVLAALSKDPKRRPGSVNALQASLITELEHGGKQGDVERLLDFSHLQHAVGAADDAAATRDEVEGYERKLRQRSRALSAMLVVLACIVAFFGIRAYQRFNAAPVFSGHELEPNDVASGATVVPFPFSATGTIGKRLDKERSDRDFYRFDVPAGAPAISVQASGLPGMALCGLLYAAGAEEPLGRYCPGSPAQRLNIPALRVPPGKYVLALLQDREAYTKDPPPPTLESISEQYRLDVASGSSADAETEPNDFPRDASRLGLGEKRSGRLAWMRDIDVFCSSVDEKVRFAVSDAPEQPRSRAAVLEVVPLAGEDMEIPVRVHRSNSRHVQASPRDVLGTWQSTSMDPSAGRPACIRLSLVPNPWAPTPHPLVAPAGEELYWVEVVKAP